MSQQTFFDANYTLAQTLVGSNGIIAAKVVKHDLSIIDAEDTLLDKVTRKAIPALVLYPGDGQERKTSFPFDASSVHQGLWSIVWHLHLPYDGKDDWLTRWDAINAAVQAALLAAGALVAPTRPGPADVRWGQSPPIWLRDSRAPEGPEVFYTVAMDEY